MYCSCVGIKVGFNVRAVDSRRYIACLQDERSFTQQSHNTAHIKSKQEGSKRLNDSLCKLHLKNNKSQSLASNNEGKIKIMIDQKNEGSIILRDICFLEINLPLLNKNDKEKRN